jgi:hypothetical protein
MHLQRYYVSPLPDIPLPPSLRSQIEPLKRVWRFQNDEYPKGIIKDNVFDHKRRMWLISRDYGLGYRAERMALGHDTPENAYLIRRRNGRDPTSLAKAHDPALRALACKLEAAYAAEFLSLSDQRLLRAYGTAAHYLRGDTDSIKYLGSTALVVAVINVIDGNHVFHRDVSAWTAHPRFKRCIMPSERGLVFGLNGDARMLRRLEALPARYRDAVDFSRRLIITTLRDIHYWWFELDRPYIPPVIKQFFSEHMQLVE